jgi:osmotically-inducible protein OsmY
MRVFKRLIFLAVIFVSASEFSMAQGQGNTGNTGNNGTTNTPGGNNQSLGQQVDLTNQLSDMNFTTIRSNFVAPSNALGGFYGNPLYSGKIGSTGITQGNYTGGFGQQLYSTGTTGGVTGSGGNFNGNSATSRSGGGATATGSNGFGGAGSSATGSRAGTSSTGASSNGFAGGSTGMSSGGAASSGGTSGFGGTASQGMTGLGGAAGGRMGQMGTTGMMGGRNGTSGTQSANVVTGDRSIAALIGSGGGAGIAPNRNVQPMHLTAQTEIRSMYLQTPIFSSSKTMEVNVAENGIAKLTGSVNSADERRLAASLAQMTPGVRSVVNELTVTNP